MKKKLRSKLQSVKKEMMASNAMVKKLTEEDALLRNESTQSSPAEVRQFKKSLVELRYSYRRVKITSKNR